MSKTEILERVAQMQAKRPVSRDVWQNSNGTFSHHKDAQREWANETACRTDLRFHQEWVR